MNVLFRVMMLGAAATSTSAAGADETEGAVSGALAILGMPPKDWITIIVSIIGVAVTIITLRSSIRNNYKMARADVSKEYMSEMLQLLKELLNILNIASSHAIRHGFVFSLDPAISPDNHVFTSQITPGDYDLTDKFSDTRMSIIEVYRKIRDKNKTAATFDKSVDSKIWSLVKHIGEVLTVLESNHPVDGYKDICETEFPDAETLDILITDIERLLFS